jgi:hypothetical protein
MHIHENMGDGSEQATDDVEKQVLEMAQPVFNIVTEDEEKEHIAQDVKKTPMHKHGGKSRQRHRNRGVRADFVQMGEFIWDHTQSQKQCMRPCRVKKVLVDKNAHIRQDEEKVHHRNGLGGIFVS